MKLLKGSITPLLLLTTSCLAFQSSQRHIRKREPSSLFVKQSHQGDLVTENSDTSLPATTTTTTTSKLSRREALASIATVTLLTPLAVQALSDSSSSSSSKNNKSLEDVELGKASWNKLGSSGSSTRVVDGQDILVPSSFATYSARILINFDKGQYLSMQLL